MESPRLKVVSAHAIPCRGIDNKPKQRMPVLKEPVTALVTTYGDGARKVCCPFLDVDGARCRAESTNSSHTRKFPDCVYR